MTPTECNCCSISAGCVNRQVEFYLLYLFACSAVSKWTKNNVALKQNKLLFVLHFQLEVKYLTFYLCVGGFSDSYNFTLMYLKTTGLAVMIFNSLCVSVSPGVVCPPPGTRSQHNGGLRHPEPWPGPTLQSDG